MAENDEVPINVFEARLRKNVEEFFIYWWANRAEQPASWPITMPMMGDWYEQFETWLQENA